MSEIIKEVRSKDASTFVVMRRNGLGYEVKAHNSEMEFSDLTASKEEADKVFEKHVGFFLLTSELIV